MGENTKGQGNVSSGTRSQEDGRLKEPDPFGPGDPPLSQDGPVLSLLNGASPQAPIIAPELEPKKRVFASSD